MQKYCPVCGQQTEHKRSLSLEFEYCTICKVLRVNELAVVLPSSEVIDSISKESTIQESNGLKETDPFEREKEILSNELADALEYRDTSRIQDLISEPFESDSYDEAYEFKKKTILEVAKNILWAEHEKAVEENEVTWAEAILNILPSVEGEQGKILDAYVKIRERIAKNQNSKECLTA